MESIKNAINNPLQKNSVFLILNSFFTAGFGFVFWIIAAKLYSSEYVGIGSVLISSMTLISSLSLLGFDQSIIKFFPSGNKSQIFSTAIIVVILSSLIFGILFLLSIDIWSQNLLIIQKNSIMFIIFVIFSSLAMIGGISLIALRKAKFYFYQGLIMSSRIIFLILFLSMGGLGVFIAVGSSYLIASIFSILVLLLFGITFKMFSTNFLKKTIKFSSGTYIFGLFNSLPSLLLPIMVLNGLGSAQTAYYYISFTIGSLILIIPASFATSLFVEGSHGESLRKNTLNSLMTVYIMITPLILVLYFFGGSILGLIGNNYENGTELLKLIALSAYFFTINQLFYSIEKVTNNMKKLIFVSFLNFIGIIGLSNVLIMKIGIVGVGYAYITTYAITSLIILFIIKDDFKKSDIEVNNFS